jgi:hypothetical protein
MRFEFPRDGKADFRCDPLGLGSALARAPQGHGFIAVAQHAAVASFVLVHFRIGIDKAGGAVSAERIWSHSVSQKNGIRHFAEPHSSFDPCSSAFIRGKTFRFSRSPRTSTPRRRNSGTRCHSNLFPAGDQD